MGVTFRETYIRVKREHTTGDSQLWYKLATPLKLPDLLCVADECEALVCTPLYLSEAFDSIDHDILVNCLRNTFSTDHLSLSGHPNLLALNVRPSTLKLWRT